MKMSMQRQMLNAVNVPLRLAGAMLMPVWRVHWATPMHEFEFAGQRYPYFYHRHNCGWPPFPCTERSVELSLADRWLSNADAGRVCEVGAVTPYYWPRRVSNIVDPTDPHPLVTARQSIFDIDFRDSAVLSISTFEHIGYGDYGLPAEPFACVDALAKLFREASQFLVTVPLGVNGVLDDRLLGPDAVPSDVDMRFVARADDGVSWRETQPGRRAYGPSGANAIVILERGGLLGEPGHFEE
jgi:hypothetical protein